MFSQFRAESKPLKTKQITAFDKLRAMGLSNKELGSLEKIKDLMYNINILEIFAEMKRTGIEGVMNRSVKMMISRNPKDFIFSGQIFDRSKEYTEYEKKAVSGEKLVAGGLGLKCRQCNGLLSGNISKQTASADEATGGYAFCTKCGAKQRTG
uniref:Transcription factor S-II n=1 Tax=Pithovirus LCDPAC01 TaxID=2506600 RepID=A0A481YP69_9VIRU|nr:MAG: transcription factor S-II [Pithovirus LCDPAC01]